MMNGKRLSWLLWAVIGLQAGCWTAYWSEEARQQPVFPVNPDGVCPEIATGVYSSSVPAGVGGLAWGYLGVLEREEKSLKDAKIPESWPGHVVSIERIDYQTVKMGRIEYLRKVGTLWFVKGFKTREIRNDNNRVIETLCDKGVYYSRRAGMGNRGIDRSYIVYVILVSKGANEEIIMKKYTRMDNRPFGIPAFGGIREVQTYHFPRLSDKPLDFDSLR